MWKVYILENDASESLGLPVWHCVYFDRWMPTCDNMELVSRVAGKTYRVLNPTGKDVTESFPYGVET